MTIEEEIARALRDFLQPEGFEIAESDRVFAQRLSPLLNRVRAEALREAADHLEATTELLNPNRGSELAYINCTRIDARELRELADTIEQNSEGNET